MQSKGIVWFLSIRRKNKMDMDTDIIAAQGTAWEIVTDTITFTLVLHSPYGRVELKAKRGEYRKLHDLGPIEEE
jgi:hypothetical protein